MSILSSSSAYRRIISQSISHTRYLSAMSAMSRPSSFSSPLPVSTTSIPSTRTFSSTSSTSIPPITIQSTLTPSSSIQFGDYSLVDSSSSSPELISRYTPINELSAHHIGQQVWLRGRVSGLRSKGNACFLILRGSAPGQPLATVQTCHFKVKAPVDRSASQVDQSKALLKFLSSLSQESIIDVRGTIQAAKVSSCTQTDVEVLLDQAFLVSRVSSPLPFSLEDASHSQAEIDESSDTARPLVGVGQDLRLNNRWLDLRVSSNNSIMRVKSGVASLFRDYLESERGFVEIFTPKIIGGESEGGSEVFRLDYFGQSACLAQSPQLYKQMAISSDLKGVFEVGPVFRAEKSQTKRHLCEFIGLDLEMEIKENYRETLGVLGGLFEHIFNGLERKYKKDLEIIRTQYPSEPVQFGWVDPANGEKHSDMLVFTFREAEALLRAHYLSSSDSVEAERCNDLVDFTTAQEILLGKIIKEKYQTDFYAVDQYPMAARPFYTMPSPTNPTLSNSYDLFLRGQEICSGAQRCHEPNLLRQQIKQKGLEEKTLEDYIKSFEHGVSPHAGAGIGLDRVVFLYLGLDNVRKASMFPRDPNRLTP